MGERNIWGELLVALLVLLLLLAVGLGGVFLASVMPDAEVAVISNVGDAVDTATAASSPTIRPSPTVTPTYTASVAASATPTHTRTAPPPTTAAPPTRTAAAVASSAVRASSTREPTPPTTELPPSATPTATATSTRTSTPPVTATRIALKPTLTDEPTAAPSATLTPSPAPSVTPTLVPTLPVIVPPMTATPAAVSNAALPDGSTCGAAPPGWTTYTVQRGNTLFSIARAVGSSVAALRDANCISNVDNIATGQVLAVPRAPVGPVLTQVPRLPQPDVMAGLGVIGCTSPASSITGPAPGQRVSGGFTVFGTAVHPQFQYYRLEVRPDFTNIYNFYSRSEVQVQGGALGQINAGLFDKGLYWVRLTVVDRTGNFIEPCAIPVIFD